MCQTTVSLAVVAEMKKPNDHAEPTKVEQLKKKKKEKKKVFKLVK